MKKLIFAILPLVMLFACSDPNEPVDKYISGQPAALLIVVENNDGLEGGMYEYGFQMYKDELLDIFADMFEVDRSQMEGKSLNKIIEEYGEEWQIRAITEAGEGFYDRVVSLTDETATRDGFIDAVLELSDQGFIVDAVFCLHGGHGTISFSDGSCGISGVADELRAGHAKLRSIYQTNCHAYSSMAIWASAGVIALNGASGTNNITMFSPSYFVESWTGGKRFNLAVADAYNREVEKIKSYSSILPVMEYILTEENLAGSFQHTGGHDDQIFWDDFPESWTHPIP